MKFEWKKEAKNLYLPKNRPETVTVPYMNFFMVDGKGNPNNEAFAEVIGVIYSLSYGVKMMPKKGTSPEGYFEYTVFPLEGVWDLEEDAKYSPVLDKDKFLYTLMIRQPDFVTDELAKAVIEGTKKKKPHALLDNVRFESFEEGLCVQMMHLGSYDNEAESFALMEEFCAANDLKRSSKTHREIYLSDFRKTQPEKLKTVLRFNVERQE